MDGKLIMSIDPRRVRRSRNPPPPPTHEPQTSQGNGLLCPFLQLLHGQCLAATPFISVSLLKNKGKQEQTETFPEISRN